MKDPKIKIVQNQPEGKQKPTLEIDTNAFKPPVKPEVYEPIKPQPKPNDQTNETEVQINNLQQQLDSLLQQQQVYQNQLESLTEELTRLEEECKQITEEQAQQQQDFISTKDDCKSISIEIERVQQELKLTPNSSVTGCTSNSPQNNLLSYLDELKAKYNKCIAGAKSTNVTTYNTVFITQIYDTNEYEGNVIVIGDDEFDDNDQLIIDCVQ